MQYLEKAKQLVAIAIELGADEADAIVSAATSVSASIFENELDDFTRSQILGAGLRVIKDHKVGYAYYEGEGDGEACAKAALANAEVSTHDESVSVYKENKQTVESGAVLEEIDEQKVIEKALALYTMLEKIEHFESVSGCSVQSSIVTVAFANSCGVEREMSYPSSAAIAQPVVKIEDWTDSNYSFDVKSSIDAIDLEKVAEESMERALRYYGAKSMPSCTCPALLDYEVVTDLLDAFLPAFSAENVQNNLSMLKGKENTRIASELVTIVDDPYHPYLNITVPFDGEGVPTNKNTIVEKGILKSLLYNIKSANHEGMQSTGNAVRGYNSPVGTSANTFYIEAGENTKQQLIEKVQNGVYIQEVSGLHAGVNAISGDFSLLSKGAKIEDGKQTSAVEQLVISGNIFDLLKSVQAIGDTVVYGFPGGAITGSPLLMIEKLSVAGS